MRLRWTALNDRLRSSMFVEPMFFVLGAIALGGITIWVDEQISADATDLPLGIASTVDSARAVLATVAGATITVAGIAFSIALLVLQLASSQYSPRVVHGLFRDPFNKRVMGLVVGTFTYCLVVLRSVRSALEDGGEPVIPNVSVALAVVLGISSVLAIIAFINHNAHTMDVSEILDTVTRQTVDRFGETWHEHDGTQDPFARAQFVPPATPPYVVRSDRDGWVQYVDHRALLESLPERTTARLDIAVGRYAISGVPLCSVWPHPVTPDDVEAAVRSAVRIDRTRTMAQDPSYGVRQLADVAIKALSPGVNDPTTAHDAIVHLGTVLAEAYRRDAPPTWHADDQGRTLVETSGIGHEELTLLAFDEIRRDSASHPRIAVDLIETIAAVRQTLGDHAPHAARDQLDKQAELVLTGCRRAGLLPHDLDQVEAVYRTHFSRPSVPG